MQILILGIGDAFTARHFGSSALIRTAGGRHVLLDCPDPIHRVLREATTAAGWGSIDARSIDDIILTHLHGDHSNGLESFGFRRRFARLDGSTPMVPRLYTSPPAAGRLWQKLAPAMDGKKDGEPQRSLADFYALHRLDPEGAVDVAGLQVECRYTGHPIPTTALRIREGDAVFGWSSDTPFDPDLIDWLSESAVIVHETNVGAPHTPIEELNTLAADVRRRMRLNHVTDDFDPAVTDIRVLRQGEVLAVGE